MKSMGLGSIDSNVECSSEQFRHSIHVVLTISAPCGLNIIGKFLKQLVDIVRVINKRYLELKFISLSNDIAMLIEHSNTNVLLLTRQKRVVAEE